MTLIPAILNCAGGDLPIRFCHGVLALLHEGGIGIAGRFSPRLPLAIRIVVDVGDGVDAIDDLDLSQDDAGGGR